jgi:dsDNA-specific endonuclease/ATPase MutS2
MRLSELLKRLFAEPRRATRATEATEASAPERERAEDECDIDPFNPFPEPVRLEISDVFDLHTVRPREVRAVVEEYLREARRKGFRSVRIIHGKGVGVQREIVRAVLARTPFVEHFSDAPPEAGGWGATIASLSAREEMPDIEPFA